MKNKYKYLLFDFDGTLDDTSEGVIATFKKVFDLYGYDYSKENMNRFIGPPLEVSFAETIGEDKVTEVVATYRKIFSQDKAHLKCRLYDGIPQTLARLRNCGYVIAVATSKYQAFAVDSLTQLGIDKYFHYVYGSTEQRFSKWQVLEALITDNNLERDKCLMIGDTLFDYEGAKKSAIDFMAVTYGFGERSSLLQVNPVAVASKPEDIADLLC